MGNILPHSWASTNPQLLMVQPLYFHVHRPTPLLFWKISPAAPILWKELLSFQTMPVLLQLYHCLLLITLRTPAIHFPVRFRILPDPI